MAPADYWTLQYTPFGSNPMNVTIPGALQMFTLSGLTRGTSYSVRLAGVNVAGLGDFSPYAANTTGVDGTLFKLSTAVFYGSSPHTCVLFPHTCVLSLPPYMCPLLTSIHVSSPYLHTCVLSLPPYMCPLLTYIHVSSPYLHTCVSFSSKHTSEPHHHHHQRHLHFYEMGPAL